MMLFDIRNAIVSLLWTGFIWSYQSTVKLEQSVGERTKLRRQRLDEIAKNEKEIDFNLFNYYFKYSIPSDMYRNLNEVDTENNKVKVNFIKNDMTDIKNASQDDVGKIEKMNKILLKLVKLFFTLIMKISKEKA